jgi:hypothetical protein
MKNLITPFIFLLFSLAPAEKAFAKTTDIRSLFLSLPDSVFTKAKGCFNTVDSFPRHERAKLLQAFDAGITAFSPDTVRFKIEVRDSLRELLIDNFSEPRILLKIIYDKKNELFFCVKLEECDINACFQEWWFYTRNKGKITAEKDVLPSVFPASLFYESAYLAKKGVSPGTEVRMITMEFHSDTLIASVNPIFFSADVVGEIDPVGTLEPEFFIRTEVPLKRKGKKFLLPE